MSILSKLLDLVVFRPRGIAGKPLSRQPAPPPASDAPDAPKDAPTATPPGEAPPPS